jgi:hypothetical protein
MWSVFFANLAFALSLFRKPLFMVASLKEVPSSHLTSISQPIAGRNLKEESN